MTTQSIEVAQAISEFGVLIVITAISITGAAMMFRSVLKNNDKLAPSLDNIANVLTKQSKVTETQTENSKALRRQVEALQDELKDLKSTLDAHDDNGIYIKNASDRTLERLEVVSERLEDCLKSKGA